MLGWAREFGKAGEPVAIVTGSSSGLGLWTCVCLAADGYRVVATMRNPDASGELLREAERAGVAGRIAVRRLDVTEPESIRAAVEAVLGDGGRIDLLVNNAGYAAGGFIEEVPPEAWREQMETNFIGTVAVTQAVLPAMRRQGSGTIANVGSISGRIGFPGFGPYASSKFAIEGFSECLRHEMAPFGVRVVLLEPSSYRTPIWRKGWERMYSRPGSAYEQALQSVLRYTQRTAENAPDARDAALAIVRALRVRSSRLRYPIGRGARLTLIGKALLPWRLMERLIASTLR
ncbi:SDR family oxidoreductase [Cohnella zeiphila]|uniref:SDR family oxidoreductase n=1 Tax=Cohnella zeiphila TaxID=2761120 RepID=A0A7X0VYB1_9BACL|nr:SDR family oxidoreductase [Cohnella zeiphila]